MGRPISVSRFERKLRAVLGVAGSNILPDVESATQLLLLEADRPEWMFAGGEFISAFGEDSLAGVGAVSYITVENPAGSGLLGVIEQIKSMPTDAGGASQPFAIVTERAPLVDPPLGQVSAIRSFARDLRWQIASGAMVIRAGNNAAPLTGAGPTAAHGINFAGGQTAVEGDTYNLPWVLPPGTRLWLLGLVLNNRISAHFALREIPLEAGANF